MRKVAIVVLARYPDIFSRFRQSVELHATDCRKILVRDGNLIHKPSGWELIQGFPNFSMAGNANLGLRATCGEDVLYSGDDVELLSPDTIELLSTLAYSDPAIGILSPQIVGGVSNPLQAASNAKSDLLFTESRLCFVCVYLKREALDRVGFLDERFSEYGYDDEDLCLRMVMHGFSLAVTPRVRVKHGFGTDRSSTFRRRADMDPLEKQLERSRAIFLRKWQDHQGGWAVRWMRDN
jgi:GT2 family glycosyltransferase